MDFKLGKLPPKEIAFKFRDYAVSIPTPPTRMGHQELSDSNMFANDRIGDCVCAGAGHETLLWNRESGRKVEITDKQVISMYSDITGYDPKDPSTDQGTTVADAASWRRKKGLEDATGKRHRIAAYTSISPSNKTEHMQSIWLFSAVGIGFDVPRSAMVQFQNNEPWEVVQGSQPEIVGGHYVAAVGYDTKYLYVITWGKIQKMSWDFLEKYNDESFTYLSKEFLDKKGKNPEGFDLEALKLDLSRL
ncbi:hypothetical protein [Leifsonia xyli]|uniref:hypothetical protein n=1 Tax=Leifsonia xyli TaxID=1575 RepID=UPI00114D01D4|nr:hypothetical protein [Leifsonia xyli]